ncbi:MAG: DUF4132 domain-containing protein [Paracoccus sp. (in: a-proteobacteria)]|nr:DUF4132 domain-containing protein [Paracoccus sp. (in: a-proteobacteria)]
MSGAEAHIRDWLTGAVAPAAGYDEARALIDTLDAGARARLLAPAWLARNRGNDLADRQREALAFKVEFDDRPRLMDAGSFDACVAALVHLHRHWLPEPNALPQSAGQQRDGRLAHLLLSAAHDLTEEPLPQTVQALHALAPALRRQRTPLDDLILARLTGDEAEQVICLAAIIARLGGAEARAETELLARAPLLPLVRGVQHLYAVQGDGMLRLRALLDAAPGYGDFARDLFARATGRLDDIAAGHVPYKADGAFHVDDCMAIGRAALYGLAHDCDWCRDGIGTLWARAVVAPDPGAKSMPSQSLAIRLGHMTLAEPRAPAIAALRAVTSACRHAGVKKKLDRMRGQVAAALTERPGRLLDLDAPLDKALALPFRQAVEGLLAQPRPMISALWRARFGPERAEGWELARALIWQIAQDDGASLLTALPDRDGDGLIWRLSDATVRPMRDDDQILLWHPVESAPEIARRWRVALELAGITQPFLQAGREIFRPAPDEMTGREMAVTGGRWVSGTELVGVARATGWRAGFHSEFEMSLSGIGFIFDAGVRNYPGAGGQGRAGALCLGDPQMRLDQIPARILSEAIRRADLLVTVGNRASRKKG